MENNQNPGLCLLVMCISCIMNKLVFLFQSLYLGHHSSLNISIFDSLWVNCDQRTLVSRLKNASFVRVK